MKINATLNLIHGPTPAPEPGTLALLASGLVGVGFVARRRKSAGDIA